MDIEDLLPGGQATMALFDEVNKEKDKTLSIELLENPK